MYIILAGVISLIVTLIAGKLLIPALVKLKAGQSIKEIGPTWHMNKQGTPTMGGLMFIIGIGVAILAAGWPEMLEGRFTHLYVYAFALVFGVIGYIDDYQKVKHHQNTGLTAPQKFILQLAAAVAFLCLMRYEGMLSPNLYIPFFNTHIVMNWVVYMIFAAFVIVGTVNAVNITDGLDGLSSSVTLPVALFFAVMGAVWGGFTQLGVFAGAMFGGLLGFLYYNHYPAKVFMGDTGSLFLGGAIAALAFAYDMPLILLLVGFVYLCETLSDIIQVAYFKATHGKRIFKMAPLHHHFEMCGWNEKKIVAVFTAVSALMCLLAYWGVADRFSLYRLIDIQRDRRRWEAQRRRQREEAERREQARTSRDRRQRTTQLERQSLMGPMDLPFLLLTLLLTGVGLVMVFSASFPSAYYETGDGTYYFKRQLIFAVLGLFAMVVMSRINYQRLRGASKLLLGFAVFLLVLVIVPKNPLAITNNNATRWLGTQSFSFQPSEIAKLAVVVYFADSISKKKRKMETWRYGIVPYLAVLGLIAILMMLEPHLSGTILIVGTGIVMMIVGGIQRWLVAAGLGGVGIVAVLYVQLVEKGIIQYGKGRIDTWRDPFNEAWFHGDGWQISQSLIAIGSGGLLGVGLGKSRQKFLYLPEEHNDCIFAVVCEELGLIGACVVMLLFALLILRGFWIALHAKDRFGTLMVVGIMTLISLQTFLNIAVVTGLIPATGISLPFFSYGGTALALQLFEMGIVLSVSRQIPAPRNG